MFARLSNLSLLAAGVVWLALAAQLELARGAEQVDYLRDVKPLLDAKCFGCHGGLRQNGSLRLDTAVEIRRGGDSGPAIEPRDPENSLLIGVVTGDAGYRMPPKDEGAALTAEEIDVLRKWIADGATAPADEKPQANPRDHWSYRPVAKPRPPAIDDSRWSGPIDAFIESKRRQAGVKPRAEAKPAVLMRRLYLDLIGLPPTSAELKQFLADPSEEAYRRIVDDLLARPQYGERWGRHWMDVWRYSDWYGSRGGNEIRYSQRHIWRWRDWIVESLNEDKGYDRMVVEMLAGDELAPDNPDIVRATGYLGRSWYKFDRNVWMFDTVEHTAQAFLGVTMRCSRCHDHKYDPISQEDYYRFRAFFEPHDVRTDSLDPTTATEKDAKIGAVLKDGLARVFDKELDAPTYVFRRGDGRYPLKDRAIEPGAPAALGGAPLSIEPVDLPAAAYYPQLRRPFAEKMRAAAVAQIELAKTKVTQLTAKRDAAHAKWRSAAAAAESAPKTPVRVVLDDSFDAANSDVWKIASGDWKYENGGLIQSQVTRFATIVAPQTLPHNVRIEVKYRALQAGRLRSIGFSFDRVDNGASSQDVYTSTNDTSQSIQAFHREAGKQHYPQAGIVKTKLRVGELTTVVAEVRDRNLKLYLNGELKLDYLMPMARREGHFALWVHEGAAAFEHLKITELTTDLVGLETLWRTAEADVERSRIAQAITESELQSLTARIAAERAKYATPPAADVADLARRAARLQAATQAVRVELEVLTATQQVAALERATAAQNTDKPAAAAPKPSTAVGEAKKKLTAAKQKLEAARRAIEAGGEKYDPLGPTYPTKSTGRRLALARWIASDQNPRTARVAVNHIWMRHFGEALAPSVENLGLSAAPPTHPRLLDWLAAELTEHEWSMKHIHRQIVLSSTYRLTSRPGADEAALNNRRLDRDNRLLTHMNSRRLEAEAIRDSVLYVTGALDLTRGGPEIVENQGEKVLRRSMYFRLTPNEKMKFLELFDVADPNSCYRRSVSVVPQQALAMSNSGLTLARARALAGELSKRIGSEPTGDKQRRFVDEAFTIILSRPIDGAERAACVEFLEQHAKLLQSDPGPAFSGSAVGSAAADPHQRARENLVHVLLNHNDFVTIR